MTNRPGKPSVSQRRAAAPRRVAEQTQIVAGRMPPPRPEFASLLAELKSLGQRSGSALSDAYARVAGSFLVRLEQLEDANAERRYRQRASHKERLGGADGHPLPSASNASPLPTQGT